MAAGGRARILDLMSLDESHAALADQAPSAAQSTRRRSRLLVRKRGSTGRSDGGVWPDGELPPPGAIAGFRVSSAPRRRSPLPDLSKRVASSSSTSASLPRSSDPSSLHLGGEDLSCASSSRFSSCRKTPPPEEAGSVDRRRHRRRPTLVGGRHRGARTGGALRRPVAVSPRFHRSLERASTANRRAREAEAEYHRARRRFGPRRRDTARRADDHPGARFAAIHLIVKRLGRRASRRVGRRLGRVITDTQDELLRSSNSWVKERTRAGGSPARSQRRAFESGRAAPAPVARTIDHLLLRCGHSIIAPRRPGPRPASWPLLTISGKRRDTFLTCAGAPCGSRRHLAEDRVLRLRT